LLRYCPLPFMPRRIVVSALALACAPLVDAYALSEPRLDAPNPNATSLQRDDSGILAQAKVTHLAKNARDFPRQLHDLVKQARQGLEQDMKANWKGWKAEVEPGKMTEPMTLTGTGVAPAAAPVAGDGPPKHFGEVVRMMKQRWKEHKAIQTAEMEPWKLKKQEEEMKKEASAQESQAGQAEAPAGEPSDDGGVHELIVGTATDDEGKALEAEAKKARYGEPLQLIVKDVLGQETPVMFRKKTPMQVLMKSVCRRLDVPPEQAFFMFKDRKILYVDTPETLGIGDQDVVRMDGAVMQERLREAKAAKAQEEHQLMLRATEDRQHMKLKLSKSVKKAQQALKQSALKKDAIEMRRFRMNDMVHLRFEGSDSDKMEAPEQLITVGHPRSIRMSNLMTRVSKRMGLDPQNVWFTREATGKRVDPGDTVNLLDMEDNEVIRIHKQDAEAPIADVHERIQELGKSEPAPPVELLQAAQAEPYAGP